MKKAKSSNKVSVQPNEEDIKNDENGAISLPDPCIDEGEVEPDGYKMSSRDNEIMEKRLTKQKELFESQLSELRAEKVQLEHKNRELTKALEDRKKSHTCILM